MCLQRFYGHYVWGRNVRKYLAGRKKPDVIFCAIPTLKASYEAAKYCEKNGVRFVIDIQDLWPEAFQMVFNVPVLSQIIFAPFNFLANGIYKRADGICGVSDTYCERALNVNKKCKKGTTVFLGTELDTFDQYAAGTPIIPDKEGEVRLAYCGTLGASYDLTCVIDAIEKLGDPNLHFVVMGDGPKKEEFETRAKEKKINATFTGRLQYEAMCCLLSHCDITINPIMHLAAQSIINKHADYAASGLPVISTQESEEYRKLVEDYDMGFNCENGNIGELANKLRTLIKDPQLRKRMGKNARKCASEKFDRKRTYKHLIKEITG